MDRRILSGFLVAANDLLVPLFLSGFLRSVIVGDVPLFFAQKLDGVVSGSSLRISRSQTRRSSNVI